MPFKSESQHRLFRAKLQRGEISQETFNQWMKETRAKAKNKKHPIKGLPERIKKAAAKEVAAIAVKFKDKMLLGKRRDNGKLTNPGGHLEGDETPIEGALRELKEETGIEAKKSDLNFIKTVSHEGLKIHGFTYELNESKPTSMRKDPDLEVDRWSMMDTSKIKDEDLHVPRKDNILKGEMEAYKTASYGLHDAFITGFRKIAGGPGSGVSGENTEIIDDLESSPLISIGYRKKFMEDHKPMREGVDISVEKIKYKGQEKYVPKKLNRMIEGAKEDDSLFEKPVKVLQDENGHYHVIDGHHRALAAIRLKRSMIKADVYVINSGEKKLAARLPKKLTDSFMKVLMQERENPQYLTTFGYDSDSSRFKWDKKKKRTLVRDKDNLERYA